MRPLAPLMFLLTLFSCAECRADIKFVDFNKIDPAGHYASRQRFLLDNLVGREHESRLAESVRSKNGTPISWSGAYTLTLKSFHNSGRDISLSWARVASGSACRPKIQPRNERSNP